jgi:uncharacterized protein YjbI with pentapeptide repeats
MFHAAANFNFAQFDKGADFISTAFSADASFSGATFHAKADSDPLIDEHLSLSASFRYATFGARADFTNAYFEGANFDFTTFSEEASFSAATFSAEVRRSPAAVFFISATFGADAYFNNTIFGGEAFFSSANFIKRAEFISATFWLLADFDAAIFGTNVDFSFASFAQRADFKATFSGYVTFAGDKMKPVFNDRLSLDLQSAKIENPDSLSFHTVALSPCWFVNVDARKFAFINVSWSRRDTEQEIQRLEENRVSPAHRLLAIACRNLAVNAEENHRYEEASKFRYMAMDARRLESWHGFVPLKLSWWYWLATGYGERVLRAFLVLILLILLPFALLYWRSGCVPLSFSEKQACVTWAAQADGPAAPPTESLPRALAYSLSVMTLQRPEPRPGSATAQLLAGAETVLGPLQAALLALAIRRQFMH